MISINIIESEITNLGMIFLKRLLIINNFNKNSIQIRYLLCVTSL